MVPVKTTWGICGGKSPQDLLNKEAGIWDRRAEDEGRKLAGHGEKEQAARFGTGQSRRMC